MKTLRYYFYVGIILCSGVIHGYAQTGVPVPNMTTADQEIQAFMDQWNLPGGSFAISKDEKLVYARGFGYASWDSTELVQPHHQFRLASISKTFASVGIMHLVEAGQLSLNDTVFGPNGILSDSVFGPIRDARVHQITVKNLLEHTGGWDRGISGDVIYRYHDISNYFMVPFPLNDTLMIRFAMNLTLDFNPGTHYAYSNLGFILLGKIAETVSGIPYEQYIQQVVMEPVGAYSAEMGKSLREDKSRQEAEYFRKPNSALVPSVLGGNTPAMVPYQYGGMDRKISGAAGNWIISAKDLLRFLTSVDRLTHRPDQLHDTTIQIMLTPSTHRAGYGLGWGLSGTEIWGHSGAIPASSTLFYRQANGISWVALINSLRSESNYYSSLSSTMDQASNIVDWPTHDLFQTPNQPASGMSFSQVTDTSITVSLLPGDGFGRVLIVREEEAGYHVPADGVHYAPSAVFGSGSDLGFGEFVVANGSPSLVTVGGLLPGRTYHFEVFEWNQTAEGYPIYLTSRSLQGSEQTSGTNAIEPVTDFVRMKVYPNPVADIARVQLENGWRGMITIKVINPLGQGLYQQTFSKNGQAFSQSLDLHDLPAGNYYVLLNHGNQVATQSFIKR